MVTRTTAQAICAMTLTLLIAPSLMSKAAIDPEKRINLHEKITAFSFQRADRPHEQVSTRFADLVGPRTWRTSPRISLGASDGRSAATSPGIEVEASYDDWQTSTNARRVDFWGTPDIHFVYTDQPTSDLDQFRMGYNVYSAAGGAWPRNIGVGCEVQEAGDVGGVTSMTVTPGGRVVFAGFDGVPADNHTYFQAGAAYSCTWGTGSVIPQAQYSTGLANADANTRLFLPIIETQILGTDTIVHMIARPNTLVNRPGETIAEFQLQYFRKPGSAALGSWAGPTVIDTTYAFGHIAASRVSSRVAISYTRTTESGYAHDQADDEAVYVKVSDDGGLNWPSGRTVITPNDRSAASITPWLETQCLYDMSGGLHVVFNASDVPADPYADGYDWSSLFRGSNVYHWYAPDNQLSLVYNATWPEDRMQSELCGWMGYNTLSTGYVSITECAGRMYVFFSMANDLNTPGAPTDDCTSGGAPNDWRFAANADIFMSVSIDLSGGLWDAPRNITQTYTPNCDSVSGHGVCLNDVRPVVARYAFDSSAFGVSLIWPAPALTPGNFPQSSDSAIQLFYIEDHYPGQYSLSDPLSFVPTLNPLRWARIACGAPICYPRVTAVTNYLGYPDYIKAGQVKHRDAVIRNFGCEDGNIGNISVVKETLPAVDWLRVDQSSMFLPAGAQDTLDVTIDASDGIFTPGTISELIGEIHLTNITPASSTDTATIVVHYLVVDTVVGLVWDTVGTTCTRLIVSANGDMGKLGKGGCNLDYVGTAADCSTTPADDDVYLYSGGPMVIKKTGTSSYVFSSALYQGDFDTDQAFRPIAGPAPASLSTGSYDGFFTGNFVNRDSSIVMNRTYYAPKGHECNFVVAETKYWAKSGSVPHVMIAEIVDWDVPGLGGSKNRSGISMRKHFVYQQGTDTSATCPDSVRWATHALLGYFGVSEKATDPCANHNTPFGMYAQLNDSIFKYDTMSPNVEAGYFWNKDTVGELTAFPGVIDDQHTVLTVKRDATLSNDTLVVYTAFITIKQGTLGDLETSLEAATAWYFLNTRGGCVEPLCRDLTGNVDCDMYDAVDIGDLTCLINNLFIAFTPLECPPEANCDGDEQGNVDIGDLTALISNLFITFEPLAPCR